MTTPNEIADHEHPPVDVDVDVDGPVTTISMVYEPYNLVGPTLLNPLLAAIDSAVAHGAPAIVVRSGLRHFSAGADLALFNRSGPGLTASSWGRCPVTVGLCHAVCPASSRGAAALVLGRWEVGGDARRHGWLLRGPGPSGPG